MNGRLSRLSRNLLLLAKIENGQYGLTEQVDVVGLLNHLTPYLENLAGGLTIEKRFPKPSLMIKANCPLLESLATNLVVNAVYHNRQGGKIVLAVSDGGLVVANTSDGSPLDGDHVFDRFYRASGSNAATKPTYKRHFSRLCLIETSFFRHKVSS